jgi:polyisoprenoid-binding protein YceI/rhodanese-related sulfurtransferase
MRVWEERGGPTPEGASERRAAENLGPEAGFRLASGGWKLRALIHWRLRRSDARGMGMSASPGPLIDLLSADSYQLEHLPGAVNLCVYETAFVEKVLEKYPDLQTPLTVYGCSDATRETGLAMEKLKEAGYRKVQVVPGGIEGWKATGGQIESFSTEKPLPEGDLKVDTEASFIRWTGRNLFNFHTGSLKLGEGYVEITGGKPVGGEFTVEMDSLACSDLEDSTMNRMLIDHLCSSDFFLAEEYPITVFKLLSVEEMGGATPGEPNWRFSGELTLRGETKPFSFEASVARNEDGAFVAQAMMDVDRTLWGSVYGSGKFFARLGQHVVNDLVHLHVKVVTRAD